MEDKVFLFCHFLKKKPYALSYILPLYYLNLFHIDQCICSIMSNVLVICIFRLYVVESYQEKMHGFLARKVFACVRMVSSFSLSSDFIFCFHLPPPPPMSSTMSVMKLSLYCSSFFMLFHFASFGWLLLWNLTSEKNLPICVVMVMVITVLFKWTSEPVKAFEGKITYIALTS